MRAAASASITSLVDVSREIVPGESVALVGPSGGGKTTLVNLIPRFYLPSEGRVLLDGQDLATIRLADLRRQIAAECGFVIEALAD